MQVAMVGLGRMGMNMARRLLKGGHEVIAYNRTPEKTDRMVKEGAKGAYSLSEVAEKLSPPRLIWIMLPAGTIVDDHIDRFKEILTLCNIDQLCRHRPSLESGGVWFVHGCWSLRRTHSTGWQTFGHSGLHRGFRGGTLDRHAGRGNRCIHTGDRTGPDEEISFPKTRRLFR
jgi:hypothetical protein